jgi:hypothetical protein
MISEGLEEYMLPCLNKQFFGIDCLGCGIQRAAALLFKGDFIAAFKMYPAIYPLLLFFILLIFNLFFKIKYAEKLKIILVTLSLILVIINYILKNVI